MSFDARDGTRGSRQPRAGGPIGRWMAKRVTDRVRRKGKVPGLSFDALVLTTVGRKTGAERSTPVGYFPGKDGSWLIVASANRRCEESGLVPQHRGTPRQGSHRDGRPEGERDR